MGATAPEKKARLEELLHELLAIPSPTGQERAIAERIVALLARTPLAGHGLLRLGNGLVAGPPPPDGRPTLALLGHLDTVPQGGCPAAGSGDGQHIRGRGACDMKAGLACMLLLAETLCPATGPCRLMYVFYDREEGPYAENGLGPLLAASAELQGASCALVLEPTGGALQLGCLGSLHVRLRIHGRAAHSARPWLGENAIHRSLPLLAALASFPGRAVVVDGLTYRESLSLTQLHAGGARNVVPDLLEANVNIRFAPVRPAAEAKDELRGLLPPSPPCELEVVDECPAALPHRHHPLLDALRRSADLPLEPKQAWTDVARLAASGIVAANFGPGDPALAHRDDELVTREELWCCYSILERFFSGGETAGTG
ncbi:MAG: succinyl-diaminopimelate desuccinylase [Deltaproteobacteria bacterium]|nr:succinyl-diaminopimelate desuccinylase [Deltaproteobacteria bacterium]